MADMYVPVRYAYGPGGAPHADPGNFFQILANACQLGVLLQNRKLRAIRDLSFYAITPDGEFAFALFFSPPL